MIGSALRMGLCGILIVLCALLPITAPAQENAEFLAAPQGRYVLGQLGDSRADQYLLDTHTGRLWQLIPGEKGVRYLEPVPNTVELKTRRYTPPPVQVPR